MPDEENNQPNVANAGKAVGGEAGQLSRPQIVPSSSSVTSPINYPYEESVAHRHVVTATTQHQGPLPTTEYLREINEIVPNGAERIMAMAENHALHSQRMEQLELEAAIAHDKGELSRSNRGLAAGFVVAMSFGIGSIYLIATGHGLPGTIFGTVDIVALASVFVIGRVYPHRRSKAKNTEEQMEEDQHEDHGQETGGEPNDG